MLQRIIIMVWLLLKQLCGNSVFKITAPATTAGKNGIVLGEAEADSYKTPSTKEKFPIVMMRITLYYMYLQISTTSA